MNTKIVSIYLFLFVFLTFSTGCADTYGTTVIITNKTGHNQLLVNNKYVDNDKSIEEDVQAHQGLDIIAFKEEFDASGNVIWGYSYRQRIDDVEEPFIGHETYVYLTPEKNQYQYK